MITFGRKIGEAIWIDNKIRIVLLDVQDGRIARIGIDAPVEVPVHRKEIYDLIQAENRAASQGNALDWLKGVEHE